MKNLYTCAQCKNTYLAGWSDEEARTEAEKNFGKPVEEWKDKAILICDDCYQKMKPANHPQQVEEAKKYL